MIGKDGADGVSSHEFCIEIVKGRVCLDICGLVILNWLLYSLRERTAL